MKKVFLIIACALITAASILSVSATPSASSLCAVSSQTAKPGDEITVTVSLTGADKLKTLGATPVYDEKTFELKSAGWTLTGAVISDFNEKKGNGAITFTEAKDCNGNIFKFVLKVKDGAAAGNTTVKTDVTLESVNSGKVCESKETTISIVSPDGLAQIPVVTPPNSGDANDSPATSDGATAAPGNVDETVAPSDGETTAPESADETAAPSDGETIATDATETPTEPSSNGAASANKPDDENDQDKTDEKSNVGLIIGIAVAIVAAAAIIIAIVFKKKK